MRVDFGKPNEQSYECKNCGKGLTDRFRADKQPKEEADKLIRVQEGGSVHPSDYNAWWFCDFECLANYVYKQSVVETEKEGVLKHLEIAIQFLGEMAEETNDKALSSVLIDEYIPTLDGVGKEIKALEEGGDP